MSPLEPVPAEKLMKLMEKVLCEQRGSQEGRVKYWRFDFNRPISFQETGMVPVIQQQQIIRILNITVEKYLLLLETV